ncbi:hypothetical protein HYC85_010972 [Camellia sinensis]|uniref:Uncharacterized protein n=1 Tax=Camellia sinensis TaxID=4442 RepID=A0A7J7HM18_CAMSI|nr:hypothetical protein HYC85_010972 [Camellia sinensis]
MLFCRCIACALLVVYLGLSYGLYVPDWKFELLSSTSMPPTNESLVYTECNISFIGQLSDNSPSWCHAPFDPEDILSLLNLQGVVMCAADTLYLKFLDSYCDVHNWTLVWPHSWTITGSLAFHKTQLDHKERLYNWCIFSFSFLGIGLFLALVGISLNKPLYTISYMLVTSASAGITFSALYMLVSSKQ